MGVLDVLGFVGDRITDFIPGGDIIDRVVGGLVPGGGGDLIRERLPIVPRDIRFVASEGSRRDVFDPPGGGNTRAVPDVGTMGGGCAITEQMSMRSVAQCRPGYVAVDMDGDGVTDTCMLKEVARACKLWKPRPKPILTASDRKALNRAERVMGRVDTVVKQTNELRGKARLVKQSKR